MAQYVILIHEDEQGWAGASEDEFNRALQGHNDFGETNAAVLRGGNALQPTSTATFIRKDFRGLRCHR